MSNHVDLPPNAPGALGHVDDPRRPLLAWIGKLPAGFTVAPHAHARAQLALCYNGLMRLRVEGDTWFVPDRHGIWIPSGLTHQLTTQTATEVHHLYIDAARASRLPLPRTPAVVRATPLLRGIGLRLAQDAAVPVPPAQVRRLAWVAFDEMTRLERPDLRLPGGRDPRLVAAIDALLADPGVPGGLPRAARIVGTSQRTLSRLFRTETGLSFREWQQRMRFMLALEQLRLGDSSTALAARLGYSSPSAFIAAFRRYFGQPPSAYRGDRMTR